MDALLSDAYAAVEWLDDRRRVGDIGVLGLSQGGLVAAVTAQSHYHVESAVLEIQCVSTPLAAIAEQGHLAVGQARGVDIRF